mmetsp:Transcript_5653/g.10720  ORF Transcript_5653/g.10720 Transcript_5653/m.10720 type:complete len:411 (+) Transcript_5653:159-1391(+)|eukprot:CAMPEP_0176496294 /NCGR_PEP_ID=MMETSP0200_2-20121128/11117_1 /TAXON_ID=947934 /ORGANISM="Chaetoceros sp., Strain GSL56" /LENGTH=410 /DNA_ID=CAMNT_0017894237 /DNA_START=64 /DNA_END=1296 /DNA_ORIENTATION=-
MPSKAALEYLAKKKNSGPQPLSDDQKIILQRKAAARVEDEEAKCTIFNKKISDMIARFDENEVKTGKKLGEGGFCEVFEVTSLVLSSSEADSLEQKHKSEIEEFHTRKYMSMTCIRKNEARYAVKRLSARSLADPTLYEKGIADLAFEAHFLSVIHHSNIIKVRGFYIEDFCSDRFFIMMDRLYDTLDKAIVTWKEKNNKYNSLMGVMKGGKEKAQELFADRMNFAWDLANAMDHLHKMKIIYRDLKPENIGFDVRGDLKIFDFGLAKEVRNVDDKGNYNLTGYCGSPMYMAPEVLKCVPYNLAADVYSYSIVLWQIVALAPPYKKLPKNVLEQMVVEKNLRPTIDEKWTTKVKTVIQKCWDPLPQQRPIFSEVKSMVYDCVIEAGGEDDEAGLAIDSSTKSFRNLMRGI